MSVHALKDDYKEIALLRQWEGKLKQQSAVNNQNTEDDLEILSRILSTSKLLLSYIYMILHYMPGPRLTQSQYAHQKSVEHFRDLIVQPKEQHLRHISRVEWHFVISIVIGYPVHQYRSTGLLPFEEYLEDWLYPGAAEFQLQGRHWELDQDKPETSRIKV